MSRTITAFALAAGLLVPGVQAPAQESSGDVVSAEPEKRSDVKSKVETSLCLLIESAAKSHDLPVDFFTRLIWRESRFKADAVGPVTRSGNRAEGIAQFMPGTAAERGLSDPFNPIQALPKSAEFLSELKARFGNLGLAAAAYNAGPARVDAWLDGSGSLPAETQRYVLNITGLSAEQWRSTKVSASLEDIGCEKTIANIGGGQPSTLFVDLEERITTSVAQPWGVQLSAGFSRDGALQSYARSMTTLESVVGQHDPIIIQSILRSRGTRPFYQIRIGAATRPAADQLCKQIKAARHACIILRNARGVEKG